MRWDQSTVESAQKCPPVIRDVVYNGLVPIHELMLYRYRYRGEAPAIRLYRVLRGSFFFLQTCGEILDHWLRRFPLGLHKVVSLISCNCRFSTHQTGTQECAPSISDPLSYTNALAGEEKSSRAIWKGNHQHEAVHGGQYLSAPLSMQRTLECRLARFAKSIPVLEHNHMVKTHNTTWRDGL